MQTYIYYPKGVCSKKIEVVLNGKYISDIKISGGCNGNLKGICSLVKGQKVSNVIDNLKGITCGNRATSCPDQLAKALEAACQQV